MKKPAVLLLALLSLAFTARLEAADAKAEMKDLVGKVQVKLKAGKNTSADLADELGTFDTLLAEHKDEKTDDVANILFMKAALYGGVLKDDAKATELLNQLKTDFPGTQAAGKVDQVLASIARQGDASRISQTLAPGAVFPDFHETDLNGKPLSLENYKGKIVLVDFWATWCGPCVKELPNVQKVYQQYHDKGFEIIGVSLDQDKAKLTAFLQEKQLPWQQYFDGKGWESKLGANYGIHSIPATFLVGKDGKIINRDLRGEDLEEAVKTALAAK